METQFLFVGVLEELPLSLRILEKLLPHFFGGAADLSEAEAAQKMKEETVALSKKPASNETREFLKRANRVLSSRKHFSSITRPV